MEDLVVSVATPDTRIVLPSLLLSDHLSLSQADAEALADEVSSKVVDDIVGREILRQTYTEQLPGSGEQELLLARWPIEDNPPAVSVIDNGTVDTSSYRVTGHDRHALYRQAGWSAIPFRSDALTGEGRYPFSQLYYSVPYTAGWLPPGMVTTWAAGTVWGVGESVSYQDAGFGWARSSDRSVRLRFEVTAGSGVEATEPTWPTTAGDTVVGDNVTFTARAAFELPGFVSTACRAVASMIADRNPRAIIEESSAKGKLRYAGGLEEIVSSFRGLM